MKTFIRRVVRRLANIPYVGRLVRMGVAIWRGPTLLDRVAGLEQTSATQLPVLLDRVAGLEQTSATQLPVLLDRVAGLEQTSATQLPVLLDRVAGLEQTSATQLPVLLDRVAGLEQTSATQLPVLLDRVAGLEQTSATQLPVLLDRVAGLEQTSATQLPVLLDRVAGLEQTSATQLPVLLDRVSEINHRQVAMDADHENLVKSVPVALRNLRREAEALRQALATQAAGAQQEAEALRQALANLTSSVTYLLGRVEFVRRELMFEMRYGASTPSGDGGQIQAKTEILSLEKLAAARNGRLRLNLGCGHVPLEGYLNVDRRGLPGVDIVAEVNELPFEQGEVDEIFSAHLLEHFPQEQLRRELLPYFFHLLKEGGEFRAVVPDAEAMIREYSNGQYPYDDIREVMYGAQDYEGDFHFNMFTPAALQQLLKETGFVDIEIVATGRRNGKCFECDLRAFRPCS